jgi:hypothetical protein
MYEGNRMRKAGEVAGFAHMARAIASKWKTLNDSNPGLFIECHERAARDLDIYKCELAEWNASKQTPIENDGLNLCDRDENKQLQISFNLPALEMTEVVPADPEQYPSFCGCDDIEPCCSDWITSDPLTTLLHDISNSPSTLNDEQLLMSLEITDVVDNSNDPFDTVDSLVF